MSLVINDLSLQNDMIHCEDIYNMNNILSAVSQESQTNLNYFNSYIDTKEVFLNNLAKRF